MRSPSLLRIVSTAIELLGALNDFQGIPLSKHLLAERGIIETGHFQEPIAGLGDEVNETLLREAHERIMSIIDSLWEYIVSPVGGNPTLDPKRAMRAVYSRRPGSEPPHYITPNYYFTDMNGNIYATADRG